MLAESDQKELLSIAHMLGIVAAAGFAMEKIAVDRDSIDLQIRARGLLDQTSKLRSPAIDVQLKASSSVDDKKAEIPFRIPAKNYEDLRHSNYAVPRLLVLFVLPKTKNRWFSHAKEMTTTRKCAYWCNLSGLPASSAKSPTVKVNKQNILSPKELERLMLIASRREPLPT